MTSSIRVGQVFPEMVGQKKKEKKTKKLTLYGRFTGGMSKYIINYNLYLAQCDAYFQINDDAKKCSYLSVTNDFISSHNSFKLLSHEALKKYALPWIQ